MLSFCYGAVYVCLLLVYSFLCQFYTAKSNWFYSLFYYEFDKVIFVIFFKSMNYFMGKLPGVGS